MLEPFTKRKNVQAKGIEGTPHESPSPYCDHLANDFHKINTERSSLQSQYPRNRFQRSRTTTKLSLQENPASQPTKRCFR